MNIPNLPVDKMIDENGNPSGPELIFRQTLVQALQQGAGPEGLVVPSQTTSNITIIVNNQLPNGEYSCLPGTLLFDSDLNELKVVILSGGVPTLKTVTIT